MIALIILLLAIVLLFTIFYLIYIKIKLFIAEFNEFKIKPILNKTIIKFIIKWILKPIIHAPVINIITNLIFYIFYPITSIFQNSKQIVDNESNKIQKKEEKHYLHLLQDYKKLEAKEKKFMQKLRIEYLKKCVFIDPQIKFYLDKLADPNNYNTDNTKNDLITYLISCGNVVLFSQDEILKNKIKENAIINNGPFGLAVCKKIS